MSFAPIPSEVPPHACETVSGRYVDVVNPQVSDVHLDDIAWALSRQVRFAGHTLGDPYHIAQHACFVEFLLDYAISEDSNGDPLKESLSQWMTDGGFALNQFRSRDGAVYLNSVYSPVLMHALCHDNTEAYLVDLPSPVKRHPALRTPYKELEAHLHGVICEALGLQKSSPAEDHAVLWADLMALQIEAANLMPSRGRGWAGNMPHFELRFMSLMPKVQNWSEAHDGFLKRYHELKCA